MDLLITGGAGFIGSTVASAAIDAGHRPIILDSLVTGRREFTDGRTFYEGDIADVDLVNKIVDENPGIAAVVHCAALIVVPESVARPAEYYRANVTKTLTLIETLIDRGINDVIFSSSGSIYEPGPDFTVDETSALAPLSPYARTKQMVELMLADIAEATDLRALSLRYFNPIGADPSFRTGLQLAAPSHALGRLIEAYLAREPFPITGSDFPTVDGTGIRDYIHVWDLAQAHVAALDNFDRALEGTSHTAVNLGTGHGTTVRQLVSAFEDVTGEPMPVEVFPPRPGDSVGAYTRSDKAHRVLDWTSERSLAEGIADTLAWFEKRANVLPDLPHLERIAVSG